MRLYRLSLQTNLEIKEHFALHNLAKKMQMKGMEEVSDLIFIEWISGL